MSLVNLIRYGNDGNYITNGNEIMSYDNILIDDSCYAFKGQATNQEQTKAEHALYWCIGREDITNNLISRRLDEYNSLGYVELDKTSWVTKNGNRIYMLHDSKRVPGGSLSIFFRLRGYNMTSHQYENITNIYNSGNDGVKVKVNYGDKTFKIGNYPRTIPDNSGVEYKIAVEILGIGEHTGKEKENGNNSYTFCVYNNSVFPDGNFTFPS